MAQAAAPTIQASADSYVLIDSVPEYEKKNVRISISSADELLASIKLQKEKKCHMYYGNDEIYIDELAGSEKTALFGTLTGKTTQGKTTYIVRKIGEPASLLYSTKELNLLFKKITRTPLFSKLAPVPTFVNTEESIYLSGVKTGKKDDAISLKEQSNVLDEAHLKEIRNEYQAKINLLVTQIRTRPIHLYAKNVKTQQFEKVSFPKAANDKDPVPVIYLNPIGGKRADAEAKVKAELDKEIADKTAELSLITAEANEYNAPSSKARKTCAAFSKVIEADLTKNAMTELEQLKKQNTELDAKKADPEYIKKTVQFGKEISIDAFKAEYVLIMSHKEWTLPGAPVAAAPAPAPEPTGATVPGTVVPQSRFFGILGGRRKTKRNNKKSHKQGKSKKQNKSRRFFKGFMY